MRPQKMVTLDVEGVLIPEVWVNLAERTGIDELTRTTRDEPNYDTLMNYRLEILNREGVTMGDLRDVLAEMGPLDGAHEFLQSLRDQYQVILLSDTFQQFASPLMKQLGCPTILCHQLRVRTTASSTMSPYRRSQAPVGRGVPLAELPGGAPVTPTTTSR